MLIFIVLDVHWIENDVQHRIFDVSVVNIGTTTVTELLIGILHQFF